MRWRDRFDPSRLRAARERRGISQTRMAELMGQKQPGYNRYENGRIKPTPQTLLKMAQVLDVEVEELLKPGPPDITLLRARRGLTQAQIAAALGRSHVWYRRVERRQTPIPPDLLARLAELLGVSSRELAALLVVRPAD